MKKWLSFLLAGIMTISLLGCNEASDQKQDTELISQESTTAEVSVPVSEPSKTQEGGSYAKNLHPIQTFYQYEGMIEGLGKVIAEGEYYIFSLSEEEAIEYPRLAKGLAYFNARTIQSEEYAYQECLDMAQMHVDEMDEEELEEFLTYDMVFETRKNEYIVRADSVAFTFFSDYYIYAGGVHPYYAKAGYNFDTETGQQLRITDLVTDIDRLNEILVERIMTDYGETCYINEDTINAYLEDAEFEEYGYNFLLGNEGVTFFFNTYVLASYADGEQVVFIPFAGNEDLFAAKYRVVPEKYIYQLVWDEPYLSDLDGDGQNEKLTVRQDRQEEETETKVLLSIIVDQKEMKFERSDLYAVSPYFCHTANGNYVYFLEKSEYDYEQFEGFEVSGSSVREIDKKVYADLLELREDFTHETNQGDTYKFVKSHFALTDPDRMELGCWLDILGWYQSKKTFHLSNQGALESDTDYYDVSGDWRSSEQEERWWEIYFTTKTDLKMDVLNADLSVREKDVLIPTGSRLRYLRTDRESYCDFRLEDDTLVRAKLGVKEWSCTIDGIELTEALDGILCGD